MAKLQRVAERPTALVGEVLPGEPASIQHADACPDPTRVEVTEPPVSRHSAGWVARCLACTASKVLFVPPEAEDAVAAAPGPELTRRPLAGEQPVADGWVA